MLNTQLQSEEILKSLPKVNGAIDLCQFIKLPGGGTHDIYQLKTNPSFLLKVIRNSLGSDKVTLQTKLDGLTSKYAKLYEVFGHERCLLETRSIQKVKQADDVDAKDAIISLVAFDDCFQNKDKFGFETPAVETMEPKLKAQPLKYHQMNATLLGQEMPAAPFNQQDYLYFHHTHQSMFELLEKEASLREVMKEFLGKFKHYYQQTDQLLDFTGHDNVVFYKEGNHWQYKVGSVIKHETGKGAASTLREIDTNPEIVNKGFEGWTHVYFVLSWLRMVNAIGTKLGMGRIIDNIPVSDKDSQNLIRMFERLPLNRRAVNNVEDHDFESAFRFFKAFEATEKEHDTWMRHMMCKFYAKSDLSLRPQDEILSFLNLMFDPKNEFPEPYWKEVREVILKLQEKLEQHGPLDQQTREKLEATLRKVGYQGENMPALLAKAMRDFEAVAVTSNEDEILEQKAPITHLRALETKPAAIPILQIFDPLKKEAPSLLKN